MSTIPDRNPPIFSPSILGGVIKPGPRFGAMHAFHGRQLAADQASHIVSYRNAVEAKRVALPRGTSRRTGKPLFLDAGVEHIGDTKLGAWRWSNAYNMETNKRIIAGKGIF